MLIYDSKKRITAKDAYMDPWIQQNAPNTQINAGVLKNLSGFTSKNKLRQAILALIATQITSEQEKKELEKTFQSLDKDGNGVLSRSELIEGYIKVFKDKAAAEQEVNKIIAQVDINNSGEIDFTEFIIAASNTEKFLSKEKLDQAFKLFDLDGDGFITRQEIAAVMGGITIDDEQWKLLVQECDTNGDGQISKDEFLILLTKIK